MEFKMDAVSVKWSIRLFQPQICAIFPSLFVGNIHTLLNRMYIVLSRTWKLKQMKTLIILVLE